MRIEIQAPGNLHPAARRCRNGLGLTALFIAFLLPTLASGEGLWDKVKSGAEKGGTVLKQGAEKGLEVGGDLTKRGIEAGKDAVGETVGHFYRDGTPEEIRAQVDRMAFDTLDRLFAEDPEANLLFDSGHGYAVFEVRQVSLTVVAGYGYGVAVSHDGSRRIYMKMVSGGVEISKGVGGFVSQWVVLFEDEAAFDALVTEGFDAGAEASGTLGKERAELGTRYRKGAAFYRVTEGGLRLAASLSGTRFWPDAWLNGVEATPAEVISGPDLAAPTPQAAPNTEEIQGEPPADGATEPSADVAD